MSSKRGTVGDVEIKSVIEEIKSLYVKHRRQCIIASVANFISTVVCCTMLNLISGEYNIILNWILYSVSGVMVAINVMDSIKESDSVKNICKGNINLVKTQVESIKKFKGLKGIFGDDYIAIFKGVKGTLRLSVKDFKDLKVGDEFLLLVDNSGDEKIKSAWYEKEYSGIDWSVKNI